MQIGEIGRTETEVVRVSVEEYKGRKYVDVRIYFENDEGEWKPTKKGVTIQPDKIDLFMDLMRQAKESL
ncbi:MAG TPA: transcriptional coactivator p15/PC4 family protein [Syntrophorhabdales bacterium]|nr:transcriptional coactivator p15/PC4 family protein [Syntrophorhabdales bacterium]